MTPGLYTLSNALGARFNAQEVLSRNLASSEILGYRRHVPIFAGEGSTFQETLNTLQPNTPRQMGMSMVDGVWDPSAGELTVTARNLDLAMRGEGYFAVETPGGVRYTRNGHFDRGEDRILRTSDGFPVLGEEGTLTLPEGEITVSENGTLFVNNQKVGKLRIEIPKELGVLVPTSGSAFAATDPDRMTDASKPDVLTGTLERSNVNLPNEMVAMLENSRLTELATRAMQIGDGLFSTAIQNLAP
ncbi:MAG: hypothetical protein AMXMBFR7_36240 [Planctomycetota bacterium]